MSRYYVIDTSCAEFDEVVVGDHRGQLLGVFLHLDSAIAMVEHRFAQGCRKVVVVESETAEQVHPDPRHDDPGDGQPESRTRVANAGRPLAERARKKQEG